MDAQAGDTILVESEKVAQPARSGVVEQVLEGERPRLLVRWEDGHTSILSPEAGAVRVVSRQRRRAAVKS